MPDATAYTIQQDFKYVPDDWWKWWVWIEGGAEALDAIDHVLYTLHSTFTNPLRTIKDRRSKFKLESAGWGVFTIYARLYLKDGNEIPLQHELYLEYPDGSENTE